MNMPYAYSSTWGFVAMNDFYNTPGRIPDHTQQLFIMRLYWIHLFPPVAQAGIAYIKELQGGHGVCAVSANYAADLKRFLT